MKSFKYIFFVFAILEVGWVFGKNYNDYSCNGRIVQFNINGKKYENMVMKVVSTTPEVNYIAGKSDDNYHWIFSIPDSLAHNIWSLQFFYSYNKTKVSISFAALLDKDTLVSPINNFENNSDTLLIDGIFLRHDIALNRDMIKVGLIDKTYMMESMKYPGFAFFYDPDNKKRYQDFIDDYVRKISENPNSVYYISNLSAAIGAFNSTNDVKELFELFSPSLKSSDYGKRINEYVNPLFENIKLPLVNNPQHQEPLIEDFTKYNLIELTASWCVWCQKIIPVLKEIGEQYKDRLIITYVTLDDEKGIVDFRKDIEKRHIKWRSLWLNSKSDNFLFRKSTTGIPCGILINKEGKVIDSFNLNNPKKLEKFHNILQENN